MTGDRFVGILVILGLMVVVCCPANAAAAVQTLDYVQLVTKTTAVPVCSAPCECMAQASAMAKWGANGYSQCSQTKCGQAPTLAAVIPYYCYNPLTSTTTTNTAVLPVGVTAINRTPVRVNTT